MFDSEICEEVPLRLWTNNQSIIKGSTPINGLIEHIVIFYSFQESRLSTDQDTHESDSDLNSLSSTQSACTSTTVTTSRRKQICLRFSSWTFQLTFSAYAAALNGGSASGSVTLQERQKYLLEHIRSRMANTDRMPHIVTFVEAYYDTSITSSALPKAISISIPLLGHLESV